MKINKSIEGGLEFIKKNPSIILSLTLIVVVTGIIFFNSYYILNKFQESVDALIRKEAVLVEDVLRVFVADSFEDQDNLQKKIEEIKNQDSEISDISILIPNENRETFRVYAATDREKLDKNTKSNLDFLAWNNVDSGIAYLESDSSSRFWNVSKVIKRNDEKLGIISLKLSLEQYDAFVRDKVSKVYWISFGSILVVLLLVLNHARLFRYAVKASKLEEVDRMKDEFISMASHELKTPLTSIRGYVDLLREELQDGKNTENSEHYLKNMEESAKRLNELVNDLLEVSRLEQNRLPIRMQELDLTEILRKITEELAMAAAQKKLDLIFVPVKISNILADPERVKQIAINLIGNAIKYTAKGKVEIKIKEDKDFVYATVADTGFGISAESLANLFSKFYRVKTDETASIAGTGLGLWISKQLALKMEGDITVESIEGVGSHFTLKLKKVVV